MPSVFWHRWLSIRKSIRPVKIEWWGTGVVICLECGANDLHMVQLMPLPPIISCFSKIQIGLPFWCQLTQVVLEKRPLNVCMYVCMYVGKTRPTWYCAHSPSRMGQMWVDHNLLISGAVDRRSTAKCQKITRGRIVIIPYWIHAAKNLLTKTANSFLFNPNPYQSSIIS